MAYDLDNILATRARAYSQKGGRRVALQLFSKDVTLLDKLAERFGGRVYRHGSGHLWIVGKREALIEIWGVIEPKLGADRPPRFQYLVAYVERVTQNVEVADGPGHNPTSEGGDDQPVPTRPNDEGGGELRPELLRVRPEVGQGSERHD